MALLWILVTTLFLKAYASLTECVNNEKCSCFQSPDELEFQCPPDRFEMVVKVKKREYIEIFCEKFANYTLEMLPDIDGEGAHYFSMKYCSLPNGSFKSILNHFNVTKVKTVSFQMYSSENTTGTRITKQLLDGLENLKTLEISYGNFTLDSDFLENTPGLLRLWLNKNIINKIGYVFKYTPELRLLDLSRNEIRYLPDGIFKNLTNLEKLHLWKNELINVNKSTFEGLTKLGLLELSVNEIQDLPEDAFSELTALVNISLRSNNLTYISRNMFKNNAALENVRLDRNPTLKLDDYVFSNFTNLSTVDISDSQISYVPEHLFEGSYNLQEIFMTGNNIKDIPAGLFKDLKNLKRLYLNKNRIEELPDNIFSSMISLEQLHLNDNNLQALNGMVFKNLRNLENLILRRNMISVIQLDTFSNLKMLTYIDLSYNKWNMSLAQTDGTSISDLTDGFNPLQTCTELEEINLEHNLINNFPEEFIQSKVKLRKLNLAHNMIDYLPIASLVTVSNYKVEVDLSNNNISNVNFRFAQEVFNANKNSYKGYKDMDMDSYEGARTVVLLNNNSIKCDCYNLDLIRYNLNLLDPIIKSRIDLRQDYLSCINADPMKFVKDLTPFDMMCPVTSDSGCPRDCICHYRPFDTSVIVDCSFRNLTRPPKIKLHLIPYFVYNQTILNLHSNNLSTGGVWDEIDGYNNITQLDLSNNSISDFPKIPPHIEVLKLNGNKLKGISKKTIEVLKNRTTLHHLSLYDNPWICDCSAADLQTYLKQYYKKVHSADVKCHDSGQFLIDVKEICRISLLLTVALPMLLTILLIFAVTVALYYRYQTEIKIYLYAKNLCLWFVTEEELDKDKTYDIFISYSHKDEDFVTQNLLPVLENGPKPFKVCIHIRDFIPGEFISKQITNSVVDSRRTLVVLSNNFLESVWGKMEFRTAHTQAISEGRARVVAVVYGDLDESALDEELKAYLRTNTYVKWGDPWFWNKLKYALPHNRNRFYENNKKHAKVMLKIDDKFELMNSTPTPNHTSTPPAITLDPDLLKNHPLNVKSHNMHIPPAEGEVPLVVTTT